MKRWILASALMAAPLTIYASNNKKGETQMHAYQEISISELKEWFDQNKPMLVLDARSKKYDDNTRLPGAKWLSYEASENEIMKMIPSKSQLVVVYCWSSECRASKFLIERLSAMGYTNLYKYPNGLQEWIQHGYPIDINK